MPIASKSHKQVFKHVKGPGTKPLSSHPAFASEVLALRLQSWDGQVGVGRWSAGVMVEEVFSCELGRC
jgi:hypothetical protein